MPPLTTRVRQRGHFVSATGCFGAWSADWCGVATGLGEDAGGSAERFGVAAGGTARSFGVATGLGADADGTAGAGRFGVAAGGTAGRLCFFGSLRSDTRFASDGGGNELCLESHSSGDVVSFPFAPLSEQGYERWGP